MPLPKGFRHSEKTLAKMRASHANRSPRPMSEATKEKLRIAQNLRAAGIVPTPTPRKPKAWTWREEQRKQLSDLPCQPSEQVSFTSYLPRIAGVYMILNTLTGERYIGSSQNLRRRVWRHRNALERGTHRVHRMQDAYDHYGVDIFAMRVLEHVSDADQLADREQYFLSALQPEYNTQRKAVRSAGQAPSGEARVKIAAKWQDPEYRAQISEKLVATRSRPEVRAEARRIALERESDRRAKGSHDADA